MNENEFSEFESRYYQSPTVSRDESLSFIDTLRDTQAQNTAQINADTYALGSQLPSNLGGLRGGEDTFIARYQTPQTEQTVADLRTAAQQSALNQALSNLQTAWKKRYQDAVMNYQRRAATPSTTTPDDTTTEGGDDGLGVDTNPGGTSGSLSAVLNPEDLANLPQDIDPSEVSGATSGGGEFDATFWDKMAGVPTPPGQVAVPFRYSRNGRDYAGILYRDSSTGQVIGVETEEASYDRNGAEAFLQGVTSSGNRIKNQNGVDLSATWRTALW